jgi:hypothetical protein
VGSRLVGKIGLISRFGSELSAPTPWEGKGLIFAVAGSFDLKLTLQRVSIEKKGVKKEKTPDTGQLVRVASGDTSASVYTHFQPAVMDMNFLLVFIAQIMNTST